MINVLSLSFNSSSALIIIVVDEIETAADNAVLFQLLFVEGFEAGIRLREVV